MRLPEKRKTIFAALLSCLFTMMQIIGYQISMLYGTSVHQSEFFQKIGMLSDVQCILVAVVEFPLWCFILYFIFSALEKIKYVDIIMSQKTEILLWVVLTVILFACWIPCFMAGYPGFYNYDAASQVPQALYEDVPYDSHHPLLHTLFMGKIIKFGYLNGVELNDGIVVYSVIQMLICAIVFAYSIIYVLNHTGKYWLSVTAFLYYAFFSPISMFSMSTTKDTIFSLLLLLSVLFTYEMNRDMSAFWRSGYKVARFFAVVVLMCLFRKNGIYALVCTIPFIIWTGKKYRKQLLILFASIITVYLVVSKSLVWMLDAEEGSPEEALSVPMQQIARVYYDHGENAFNEEEWELIDEGISRTQLAKYNPFLADNIKNYFDYYVMLDNKSDYIWLWIKKGLQYPKSYVKAFLDNTYQAWYPGTSIFASPDKEQTYYFDMTMHSRAYRDSRNTELLEFYNDIATGFSYQKIPVIRLLFSIGAMFWVELFALVYAIYRKNIPLTLVTLLVLFYCATVFMGPISLVRYYLILFYGFPVALGYLFGGRNRESTTGLGLEVSE